MNNQQLELRQVEVELTGQTINDNENGIMLRVSGYVNETDSWSQPLGREKRFVEKITPGTFQRAIDNGNHIHFLAEHDNKLLLASTKNGSLNLREDDKGLFMEATISPTSWGKDYHQLISDGLLTNMSFGMAVPNGGDTWQKRSDGTYERTITDMYLAEVSVVRNPAYVQSSIAARSIDIIDEPTMNITKSNEKEKVSNMSKEKLLNEMRAQMVALEAEVRAEETATVEVRETEDKSAVELRGVEEFIRGNVYAPEVRSMTSTSGALTVPVNLSNQIIEKLVEQASIFGRAKGFQPVAGNLEILKENEINSAAFVGEMENINPADFTFDKVVLEQRRAGTAIELSQQLVNDSGINVVEYATGVMTRRLARKLDESALIGDKTQKQFEGILTSAGAQTVGTVANTAAISIDNLLDMTLSVHPDYLDGAVFVVNRATFNAIAKLKDANGQYHLVRDVVNGKPAYKILGHEILIQESMPTAGAGKILVAFANFGVATASMIKRGAQFKRISDDTTQALRGSHLLMLDIYCDFKVVNDKAIKFLKQA